MIENGMTESVTGTSTGIVPVSLTVSLSKILKEEDTMSIKGALKHFFASINKSGITKWIKNDPAVIRSFRDNEGRRPSHPPK